MPARLLLAALLLVATPAFAQDDGDGNSLDDIPHITIVGTAHADVAPDLATITLGVTTEKPTAAAAAAENARKAQAVVDAAKAQGIAPADIATQSVTLSQTFDDIHDAQGHFTGRKPRGFEAQNLFAIRIRDLGKAGTLAQSLIEKGANRFDGIGFSVEHPEQAKLTGEAVKNARAQAQMAAEAAGAKLGRVLSIGHPSAGGPEFAAARAPMMAARAKAAPAMPVEAGTSGYDVAMEVTWALGD